MTEEIWKPVAHPDFARHYEVSSLGRVRRKTRGIKGPGRPGHILWQRTVRSGHKRVLLCNAPARKHFFVHTLVMEAFVGPKPDGTECCHNDSNPANNVPSNLRWGTPSSNRLDRPNRGVKIRGELNCNSKLSAEAARVIRSDMRLAKEVAADFGISPSTVLRIRHGRLWAHV